MTRYVAPLNDVRFALDHIADVAALARLPGLEAGERETVEQVLGEAGKLAAEVLAPLNRLGDTEGAVLENGVVRHPEGFKAAYDAYRAGGWNAVPFDPAYGGMGLPWAVGVACMEFWNSANMGFALCPVLNQGAVEAIHAHGTTEQKDLYLPKLISGEWCGTMNLTEPQAGSDVGALRSRAEPVGDGSWKITGQKIYISYGEHEFADNIVHLVLARTPGSPEGTRGISLFLVPKYLPNPDGTPGTRNDLRCVSLEHKLGIHASPTCVMSYGDDGGAIGWLLGEENKGMRCMFTMMNAARLAVGIQGVAIAERAWQQAASFAMERRQGRAINASDPGPSAIVEHADVRRMLMTMKSHVEAARAICYVNAEALDLAHRHEDEAVRARYVDLAAFYTPISKAWCTDVAVEVCSLGVQVHGGMGFVEETGAAQFYRDARILPIYEGTNGIQAMDLLSRKLTLRGGEVVQGLLADMRALDGELERHGAKLAGTRASLAATLDSLATTSRMLLDLQAKDANAAAAGCSPYLAMWGLALGGWLLAKGAVAAADAIAGGAADAAYLEDRITVARFFCEQVMPRATALAPAATAGADLLYAAEPERLIA